MKRLKYILIAIAFTYVSVSFLSWELSPSGWSAMGRLGFIATLFIATAWAYFLSIPKEAFVQFNKNLQAKREEANQADAEANRKRGGFHAVLQAQLDKAEEAKTREDSLLEWASSHDFFDVELKQRFKLKIISKDRFAQEFYNSDFSMQAKMLTLSELDSIGNGTSKLYILYDKAKSYRLAN